MKLISLESITSVLACLTIYSKMYIYINMQNFNDSYSLPVCWLFQFLITAFAFVTFAVEPENVEMRLNLSFTLILTTVAFKFVAVQMLPKVSYLTYLVSNFLKEAFHYGMHGFSVSHLLPCLCDICRWCWKTSEPTTIVLYLSPHCCSLQVCRQPESSPDIISYLFGNMPF